MAAYEIAVSLRVREYLYTESRAVSPAAGDYDSFEEALLAFCDAVSFGYAADTQALDRHLASYGKKARDVDKSLRLLLLRHEDEDVTVFENIRADGEEDPVISCGELTEEEADVLFRHGVEPEEDSLGSYFEVYPLNELLYDLSDACDGALDPADESLRALVREYALAKGLLLNEIDPAEDGYFCPSQGSEEDCFDEWGQACGYTEDEREIFTGSLVRYTHGYVLEFRE